MEHLKETGLALDAIKLACGYGAAGMVMRINGIASGHMRADQDGRTIAPMTRSKRFFA